MVVKFFGFLQKKGFFHLLSVNFLTQFLAFGALLFVSKLLSPEEIGLMKIIHSYSEIFILLGTFGFNAAVLKVCAEKEFSLKGKQEVFKGVIVNVTYASIFSTALLGLLCLLGVITLEGNGEMWLMIYALAIPFACYANVLISYLQSLKKIKEMSKAQLVVRVQFFLIILMSTYFWGFKGLVISTVLSYVAGIFPFLYVSGVRFLYESNARKMARLNSYAFYTFLGAMVTVVAKHLDIYLLENLDADLREVGYYSLAVLFTMAANQINVTVQSIVTPYFSENSSDKSWFVKSLKKYQILMSALSIFIAAGVYITASVLVHYYYGKDFSSVLDYLEILLIRYVVWSAFAVTGVALLGLGIIKEGFYISCITTPIGVALGYYLYMELGVIGVAWAKVGVAVLTFFMIYILLFKVLEGFDRIAAKRAAADSP